MLDLIRRAIEEDVNGGDITSRLLFPRPGKAQAVITAKEEGVVAGMMVAMAVFVMRDSKVKFMPLVMDGSRVKPGQQIAYIEADLGSILTAERTALNFLSRLSGIATLTARFVDAVVPYKTRILDTRKTTPGMRLLEKYAVSAGGGSNHRIGLFDQVLIKDNHIAATGNNWDLIAEAVKSARKKRIKSEVEVQDITQFRKVLEMGPDIIMLDNMTLKEIKQAVKLRDNGHFEVKLEVSGGVNLRNIRKFASSGVDLISIGALTHSAKAIDFSLEIVENQ
jgi:nicotinate-nucleotide pyrophosphorylase (carboxylating)